MMKRIVRVGILCCLGIAMTFGAGISQKKVIEEFAAESQEHPKVEMVIEETGVEEQKIEEMVEEQVVESTVEMATLLIEEEQEESKPAEFAIADVDGYVNVRNQPTTEGEIIGKIYDGAIAEIIAVAGEQEEWFQITSGNVEGYIKAEFFLSGEQATVPMEQYMTSYAVVSADKLNVREDQSTDSSKIGYIKNGEKIQVLEDCGEWLRVKYAEEEGYIATQYATVSEEYVFAKTLEEDRVEAATVKEWKQRGNENGNKIVAINDIVFPATSYTSNEELRKAIVNYALQYVGNKYVNGGSSLESGTDCSGFTCFIYADFGYSISRTPEGQFSGAGRSIDYSEIQPGDVICYSSNGGASCTHVALYIGDGQIVHAANSRKGVITSKADYEPIIGIRNIID